MTSITLVVPNAAILGVANGVDPLLSVVPVLDAGVVTQTSPFALYANTITVSFSCNVDLSNTDGTTIEINDFSGPTIGSTLAFTEGTGFSDGGELGTAADYATDTLTYTVAAGKVLLLIPPSPVPGPYFLDAISAGKVLLPSILNPKHSSLISNPKALSLPARLSMPHTDPCPAVPNMLCVAASPRTILPVAQNPTFCVLLFLQVLLASQTYVWSFAVTNPADNQAPTVSITVATTTINNNAAGVPQTIDIVHASGNTLPNTALKGVTNGLNGLKVVKPFEVRLIDDSIDTPLAPNVISIDLKTNINFVNPDVITITGLLLGGSGTVNLALSGSSALQLGFNAVWDKTTGQVGTHNPESPVDRCVTALDLT